MKNKQPYFSKDQQQTLKLVAILSICVLVLLIVSLALFYSFDEPAANQQPQYAELPVSEGMKLADAKAALSNAEIKYEIVPTQSRTPNKVEKIEYVGKTENGKTLVEVGTTVKLHANEVSNDKIIYLTFDDGPTRDNTLAILDTLDQFGIKATFFVQGKNVDTYPDRIVATVERGHLVGCHSYSHQIGEIYSSISVFSSEIDLYEEKMKQAIGEDAFASISKVMRFPGGTTTNSMLSISEAKEYLAAAREKGYKSYDWTLLTKDAEGSQTAEEFIANLEDGLEKNKGSGKPLIALLHDKWSTNEALHEILDYLVSKGYYFDTIDNCPEFTFAEN